MPANNEKKPIQQITDDIKAINKDMGTIKSDIEHIKKYIRLREVREELEREKNEAIEKEYVKTGWIW
jgi:uncharacterized protein (UPF0335 family)